LEGTLEGSLLSRLESNTRAAICSQCFLGSNNQIGTLLWYFNTIKQLTIVVQWDPKGTGASLRTFKGHSDLVYAVSWSPLLPNCFASVSGDKFLSIWNSTKPDGPVVRVAAHHSEILTCDWSKYDRNVIATGGVDGRIKGWDLRNTSSPSFELAGHEYAIKRVRFSPHQPHMIASSSYDFTTRVWNYRQLTPEVFAHHREFVYGVDFSCLMPNKIADCSWDRTVSVYSPQSLSNNVQL